MSPTTYKLLTLNNWVSWKFETECVLDAAGVLEETEAENTVEPAEDAGKAAWKEKQQRRKNAMKIIALATGPETQPMILSTRDPYEAMKKLKDRFERKTTVDKGVTQSKYRKLVLESASGLLTHFYAFEDALRAMTESGQDVKGEQRRVDFITSICGHEALDGLVTVISRAATWEEARERIIERGKLINDRLNAEEEATAYAADSEPTLADRVAMLTEQIAAMTSGAKGMACFNCGKSGHYARDCRSGVGVAKLKECWRFKRSGKCKFGAKCRFQHSSVQTNAAASNGSGTWSYRFLADSGSSCHSVKDQESLRNVEDCYVRLRLAKGEISATRKGNVPGLKSKALLIENGNHNLLSLGTALDDGQVDKFELTRKEISGFKGTSRVLTGERIGKLWYVDTSEEVLVSAHVKAGHLPARADCRTCNAAKMKKKHGSHPTNDDRASVPLSTAHVDIVGPFPMSRGGKRYLLVITDDATSLITVFAMGQKSDTEKHLREYFREVRRDFRMRVEELHTDRGGEFIGNRFAAHLDSEGILHIMSPSYTPASNGRAEVTNSILLNTMRSIMIDAGAEGNLWAEAAITSADLINQFPRSRLNGKTPVEKLQEWVHCVKDRLKPYRRVFGSDAYVLVEPRRKQKKLSPKSRPGIYLGPTAAGFRVLVGERVLISKNVRVMEGLFTHIARLRTDGPLVDWERVTCDSEMNNTGPTTRSPGLNEHTGANGDASEIPENPAAIPDNPAVIPENPAADLDYPAENPENPAVRQRRNRRPPERFGEWADSGDILMTTDSNDPDFPTESSACISQETILMAEVDGKQWDPAKLREIAALKERDSYTIVRREDVESGKRILGSTFRNKIKSDGTWKSRLCAQDFKSRYPTPREEVYAAVMSYMALRWLFSLADYESCQSDCDNAYLQSHLKVPEYVEPPEIMGLAKDFVLKFSKSLYGLQRAGNLWRKHLKGKLHKLKFRALQTEAALFCRKCPEGNEYILVWVDDLFIFSPMGRNPTAVVSELRGVGMALKDAAPITNALGMSFEKNGRETLISSPAKIEELLLTTGMEKCNPTTTPILQYPALEDLEPTPSEWYRSTVGSLQWLAATSRPDIAFAVNVASRYVQTPAVGLVKRILRYLRGTTQYALRIRAECGVGDIEGFSDSDFAQDTVTRKSTSGYVFVNGSSTISWSARRQQLIALSSCEAEYYAMCEAGKEAHHLRNIIKEVTGEDRTLTLRVDNQAAELLSKSGERVTRRTKHYDLRHFWLRDAVTGKRILVNHVPSKENLADIFTKALGKLEFIRLRGALGVVAACEGSVGGTGTRSHVRALQRSLKSESTG